VQDYLSSAQAAVYLGISQTRINELARAGKIARVEVAGYFVYRREDLDAWRVLPKSIGGRPKKQESGATA
jgi:excisionase family DNA binding protein